MSEKTSWLPEGHHRITPYLIVDDATAAIEFYKKVFGAKETGRIAMADGKIGHAEIQIGDSKIMLADEFPEWGNLGPKSLGGTAVGLSLYVENVDKVFETALREGATAIKHMEVKDQFYGDRSGTLLDPFGHKWTIATHIAAISFEEMQKRADAMFSEHQ